MIIIIMIIAVIQSIFKLGPKICLKYEVDKDKQSTHSRLQGKLPKTQPNKYQGSQKLFKNAKKVINVKDAKTFKKAKY